MSWLARSIVNTLKGEDEDEEIEKIASNSQNTNNTNDSSTSLDDADPTRGVKEDISELTKTLTRQFWGVASYLAPPPSDQTQTQRPDLTAQVESPRYGGIRNDFAEISGKFKSGMSMISGTKAVSELSKIASNLLQFGDDEDVVGINEEVVTFARNVSMQTWIDFPLMDDNDEDDFDMSDAQQEHALAIERLAPSLAELRIELCPGHMSEGRFWKIYFVLLHSRLNRSDADLLTTPQIVQAREMLLQDIQTHKRANPKESDENAPEQTTASPSDASSNRTLSIEVPSTIVPIVDNETEKHTIEEITELEIIDKSVIQENPSAPVKIKEVNSDGGDSAISIQKYENDEEGDDDWLEEEDDHDDGKSSGEAARRSTTIPLGNDEDVSFSDLEDE